MYTVGSMVQWLRFGVGLPVLKSFIAVGFEKGYFISLRLMYIIRDNSILHMLVLRIK